MEGGRQRTEEERTGIEGGGREGRGEGLWVGQGREGQGKGWLKMN